MLVHGTHKYFLVMGCRCDMCTKAFERYKDKHPNGYPFDREDFMQSIRNLINSNYQQEAKEHAEWKQRIDDALKQLGIRP